MLTRKGRHAAGRMLVEGVRLLTDAWRSGFRPEIVFYAPEKLTAPEGMQLLSELETAGCLMLPCTTAVFATLSETTTPQGIAAVLPLPQLPWPTQPTLLLVLDGVSDPGNAGALLRSAEAAGCDGVIFAPGAVDPFNDKVVRAGMSAHFRLPLRICATWTAVAAQLPPDVSCYLADAHATLDYATINWRTPSVLIVSNEAHGASADARARSAAIAIPMHGGESLNAAVAGSVILFEAARQRRMRSR
ncbi:MAG TPA: RNA methyltransferase [Chloroflexi bacterium]|nr:RNA methyltransferase [Chloroflexota bacterium]